MFTIQQADLTQYPSVDPALFDQTVTMGDGHGNPVKVLYFLMMTGRINPSQFQEEDYRRFYDLSTIPANRLQSGELSEMIELTQKLERHPSLKKGVGVRFIGDNFADRGECDLWMLLIYERLAEQKIPFCELLSNHTMSFLRTFIGGCSEHLGPQQAKSLYGLKTLITRGLINEAAVRELVNQYLIPSLRVIDAILNTDSTTPDCASVYAHAPIPFGLIDRLARELQIEVIEPASVETTVSQIIPQINHRLLDQLYDPNFYVDLNQCWDRIIQAQYRELAPTHDNITSIPFAALDQLADQLSDLNQWVVYSLLAMVCWNRDLTLDQIEEYQGRHIRHVHGHTGGEGVCIKFYDSMGYWGRTSWARIPQKKKKKPLLPLPLFNLDSEIGRPGSQLTGRNLDFPLDISSEEFNCPLSLAPLKDARLVLRQNLQRARFALCI